MKYITYNHRQAEEILNSKLEIFKEIKGIISGLSLMKHNLIKEAFKNMGWKTEERISNRELEKAWRYDAFKNRVAIEIELSTCYRSFLKFILGYNEGKIDVGVILTKDGQQKTRGHPMSVTERELKDLFTIIPVPIYLMGLYP